MLGEMAHVWVAGTTSQNRKAWTTPSLSMESSIKVSRRTLLTLFSTSECSTVESISP